MNVRISGKAIERIKKETVNYYDIGLETGGILLGYCNSNEINVVEIVSCGPNAIHTPNKVVFDVDYVEELSNIISSQYNPNLDLIGLWHTHSNCVAVFSLPDKELNDKYVEVCSHDILSGISYINDDNDFVFKAFIVNKYGFEKLIEFFVYGDLDDEKL